MPGIQNNPNNIDWETYKSVNIGYKVCVIIANKIIRDGGFTTTTKTVKEIEVNKS